MRYSFETGSYDAGGSGSNEIRLATLKYPNNRVITYDYGTSGGMNDLLNRVDTIQDTTSGTTNLASYTYLGMGTVVRIEYPEPEVWLDLWGGTSGTFSGLDLFGRIKDQRWQNNVTGTAVDIDRYKYGYDYNSNRQWKANVVGTAAVTSGLDEYYTYDNLNRLTLMQRGVLNSSTAPTGITGTPVRELSYGLDPTGNWTSYITATSSVEDLGQTRASNKVNEITGFTTSTGTAWATPGYDPAGNMTTMPQPTSLGDSFTATYDAWRRMTSISSGGSLLNVFKFDGRNRMIQIIPYSGGTAGTATDYYYTDDWREIEQRVSGSMSNQHVWGVRYVDELVCRDTSSARVYATEDANFNVTGLLDTSGSVLQYFVYDPYGLATAYTSAWSGTTDAYSWTRMFTGQFYVANAGIYVYRERLYHPPLGTFLSRDQSITTGWRRLHVSTYRSGNEINLHQYVASDPISLVDPTGNDPGNNPYNPGCATNPQTKPCSRHQIKVDTEGVEDCAGVCAIAYLDELKQVGATYGAFAAGLAAKRAAAMTACTTKWSTSNILYNELVYACQKAVGAEFGATATNALIGYEAMKIAAGIDYEAAIQSCWNLWPCASKTYFHNDKPVDWNQW